MRPSNIVLSTCDHAEIYILVYIYIYIHIHIHIYDIYIYICVPSSYQNMYIYVECSKYTGHS